MGDAGRLNAGCLNRRSGLRVPRRRVIYTTPARRARQTIQAQSFHPEPVESWGMKSHPVPAAAAALLVCAIGCAAERRHEAAPVARARVEPQRTAEATPAVKALLEKDPDLEVTISRDEVRAALELAKANETVPPAEPALTPAGAPAKDGEWSRLEQQKKEKLDAHKQRLESTMVMTGPDGAYHTAGCEVLYSYIMLKDGTVQRVYTARQVTLAHASQSGMSRHAACGAPTAEFSYR